MTGASRYLAVFSLFMMTLSIGACSGITRSDKAAVKTWWLKPYTVVNPVSPSEPRTALATSVIAVPGLDTDRILTLSDNAELNHFAAARWADNLPELMTSLINRSLQASGRFEITNGPRRDGVPRCDLQLEIREFFARLDASGQASGIQLAIAGRYQCGPTETVNIKLGAVVPVAGGRMSEIVTAFQQALDSAMMELLDQTG